MQEMLQQPALATPPGVVSLFPDTMSSSARVVYYPVAVLTTVVPGVLFITRIYTKVRIIGGLDVTDLMLSLAWPFFVTIVALGWAVVINGGGAHQWNIRYIDYINVTYYYYVVEIVYCPCIVSVKTAILLQYQRTFSPHRSVNPFMWWATKGVIATTGVYYIFAMLLTAFACRPRAASWNPLITDAKCLNNNLLVIITCIFNILSDLVILLLPSRAVWKLQIPTRKKAGIVALFALGLLAVICNGMIIYYFFQAADTGDFAYNLCWAGFWGYAEVSFGLIVSSAIVLPRFFKAKGSSFKSYWSNCLSRPVNSITSRVFRGGSSGTGVGKAPGSSSGSGTSSLNPGLGLGLGGSGWRSQGEGLPLSGQLPGAAVAVAMAVNPVNANHVRLITPAGKDGRQAHFLEVEGEEHEEDEDEEIGMVSFSMTGTMTEPPKLPAMIVVEHQV